MARAKETDRPSGKAESRHATTAVDRLRVAKRQLQSFNKAQTKLYTMFEEMTQELEHAKEDIDKIEDSWMAVSYKLDATETELDTTKSQLAEVKGSRDMYRRWWLEDDRALSSEKRINEKLATELAIEKEKAKKNNDAQEKLNQLQKQWSSLSHILGNEDHKC